MKWRSLLFLFTCMLVQKCVLLADTDSDKNKNPFEVKKVTNGLEFKCAHGSWKQNDESKENMLTFEYQDKHSGDYTCEKESNPDSKETLTIKFRTCENCIELDNTALSAIIVGNILATALIGYAVYSITGQPKSKTFSGNKASDKVNLITNGEGDTYQRLTPGQSSEYSGLVGRKK